MSQALTRNVFMRMHTYTRVIVIVINSGLMCVVQRNPIMYRVYSRVSFDLWSADRNLCLSQF